jgi:hypothetical protein
MWFVIALNCKDIGRRDYLFGRPFSNENVGNTGLSPHGKSWKPKFYNHRYIFVNTVKSLYRLFMDRCLLSVMVYIEP